MIKQSVISYVLMLFSMTSLICMDDAANHEGYQQVEVVIQSDNPSSDSHDSCASVQSEKSLTTRCKFTYGATGIVCSLATMGIIGTSWYAANQYTYNAQTNYVDHLVLNIIIGLGGMCGGLGAYIVGDRIIEKCCPKFKYTT